MIVKRIKFYSEPERGGVRLEDIKSHRGLGRSLIGGLPGVLGGYAGKKAANKADAEGKSDEEIKKIATKKAARRGAAIGSAFGLANAAIDGYVLKKAGAGGRKIATRAVRNIAGAVGLSALGAGLGAKKNTKERLKKINKMDPERYQKRNPKKEEPQRPNPGIYIVQ